ncbi:ribonuclease HI [Vibrio parahaemolyticus]|nr:ribonuclease HI [Vibrio parahaemolyticus]
MEQLQTTYTLHNAQRPLSIYCDGSAPDNQHGCLQGGVGVAVYDALGHCIHEYSSTVRRAGGVTNQRAELLALIIALFVAGEGDSIFSDSKYCVQGFNEWLDNWKRNAWRNSSKKLVANQDLWMLVDELKAIRPRVSVEYVAGHSGIKGNEHSDRLATQAAVDSKQTLL